ncbi:hypothetical protein SY2F82_49740 [Streptomyces sp. Y2F8-2]|nr:hypothetical protein SY2F82_49740 [Streptomyces sp. Y2F8-2]
MQTVRSPGTCTAPGRPAPAVATIAVPITEAYQFGPRYRTAGARRERVGRERALLTDPREKDPGGWAAVTMDARSRRAEAGTRDHASMWA